MNIILNFILYFLIFAIIHSVLAADYIKNKAQMLIEERRLLSIFGDEYQKYRQQVSMFIPVKWIKKQTAKLL